MAEVFSSPLDMYQLIERTKPFFFSWSLRFANVRPSLISSFKIISDSLLEK